LVADWTNSCKSFVARFVAIGALLRLVSLTGRIEPCLPREDLFPASVPLLLGVRVDHSMVPELFVVVVELITVQIFKGVVQRCTSGFEFLLLVHRHRSLPVASKTALFFRMVIFRFVVSSLLLVIEARTEVMAPLVVIAVVSIADPLTVVL